MRIFKIEEYAKKLDSLKQKIACFDSISLSEMDEVKLMNRTDTKFVFSSSTLLKVLPKLVEHYRVLEIEGVRLNSYRSLYFDTDDFKFYHEHHNGKTNRHKVRYREYIDSKLAFLEVKRKNNKGKTVKKRIKVQNINGTLEEKHKKFVENVIGEKHTLVPQHWNLFNRITFVHRKRKERLTIDLNFRFQDINETKEDLGEMVIAEIKQKRKDRSSDFVQIVKEERIHPFKISKYCMATARLFPHLKRNNFKSKFLHLEKIQTI